MFALLEISKCGCLGMFMQQLTASACIIKEMLVKRVPKDIFLHFFFFLLEFQLPGKKCNRITSAGVFPFLLFQLI